MLPQSFEHKTACCFTGHRPAGLPARGDERDPRMDRLKYRLLHCVEEAMQKGVRAFLCGGAAGFDLLAAEAVVALRPYWPQARLLLALPFPAQADGWPIQLRRRYDAMLEEADELSYVSQAGGVHALLKRNRYLVEHADCCIAYLSKASGGTLYTVNYALDRGLPYFNLYESAYN